MLLTLKSGAESGAEAVQFYKNGQKSVQKVVQKRCRSGAEAVQFCLKSSAEVTPPIYRGVFLHRTAPSLITHGGFL